MINTSILRKVCMKVQAKQVKKKKKELQNLILKASFYAYFQFNSVQKLLFNFFKS